jgi:DNA-binding PadR family transcriptional regulator
MSAKHAVLGLVIERPGYGYELGRRLEERCGAWGWQSSGVYTALDQLARDKHVRCLGEKGSGETGRAAPRLVYESTPRGVEFFKAWILGSAAPSPFRQELDLKVLFAGPEFLPRLIDQTWAQEQMCVDQLRGLTSATPSVSPDRMSWREAAVVLQRDAEMKFLQVRIEWLQDARQTMRKLLDRSARERQR